MVIMQLLRHIDTIVNEILCVNDWIKISANELGIKELIPAYLDPNLTAHDLSTGVSFASGGSGYDPQTSRLVSVIPMSDQLNKFKEYIGKLKGLVGEEGATNILSQALFLLSAGTNDLANTYFTIGIRKMQYDLYSYVDFIVGSNTIFLQELYKLGARRFVVFGIPPIGCLPLQITATGGSVRSCSVSYNQATQMVNSKISPRLDALNQDLPQSRVVYIDILNPLFDIMIIQHPLNYGFKVNDKGCCGTGNIETVVLCNIYSWTFTDSSKYVFWDSYHPTETACKILVHQIVQKYVSFFLYVILKSNAICTTKFV
ncbi:GDSL esterase/lipase EXL3-like [Henckelia pumila]|uniref:GDSL esterase/lipase EXL3-like n=1 Tax=Henckelia pumila TaxID=405737 RepID=UPI003C6E94BB